MTLPQPYEGADDRAIVDGCLAADEDAWAALRKRYGPFVQAAVVRALDGPRAEEIDLDAMLDRVWEGLRDDRAVALRQWRGESQLRSYLAILARRVATRGDRNSSLPLVASMPTPSGVDLADLVAVEPARRVQQAIDKLPPNVAALVRLRLRGLSREDIAATLGMSPTTVQHNLERVAARLAEADAHGEDVASCWRVLLDAADATERVALALRTEDDPDFRPVRSLVEKTWRAVGTAALAQPPARTPGCLDDRATAGFVDGTLRGASRARAEGHVATCPRCIDEAAALVIDLRVTTPLRDAAELDPTVAVAAACVATTRFETAERLAARASQRRVGGPVVADVRRLAQAARLLEGGPRRPTEPTSQVVATHVPADDEAPLVAFEALVLGDPHTAWRAIDDHMAKQSLGARLRLLAAAAGQDLDRAAALATAELDKPRVDPGQTRDAEAVAALPRGRALPREILVERLRALLPEAVRFILTRA